MVSSLVKTRAVVNTTGLRVASQLEASGKRANFVSIQLSHQLPTKEGRSARIRTGYERVMAHLTSTSFAYCAKQKGKVLSIDEKLGICTIQYADKSQHAIPFGEIYGECSDMRTTLKLKLNVKLGESFKEGDVLTYNPEFFELDPITRQVDWIHGVPARFAFMDCNRTFEDSSTITKELGEKLTIQPVDTRQLVLNADTIVHDFKSVGDEVDVQDFLMITESGEAVDLSSFTVDEESLKYIANQNKKTNKAKIAGKIVKIEAYYACPISEMSPSLGKFVRQVIKDQNTIAKLVQGTDSSTRYPESQPLPEGTKFKNVLFDKNTVMIRYSIQETLAAGIGDKIVLDSSLKSVVGSILDGAASEDGKPLDGLFSVSSVSNRIVNSPIITGVGETVLEQIELDALKLYFG